MIFILEALICAVIGVVPFLLVSQVRRAVIFGIIYGVVGLITCYLACFSLNYPLGGSLAGLTLLFLLLSSVIIQIGDDFILGVNIPWAGVLVVLVIVSFSGCEALNTDGYSSLIGDINTSTGDSEEKDGMAYWTQQTQELSPTHIRIVPHEHALSIAKTALNQNASDGQSIVGSQFELLEAATTLQKVGEELFYVIPLDYRRFGVWQRVRHVPGYVIVHAEDQHSQPKYVDGYTMKYTPQAYFGQNLQRFLYTNGFADKILTDYTFEIDDQMKPYWVVTVADATISYWGEAVEGCLVVDPETGEFTYYKLGEAPDWVDRVVPSDVVQVNIRYWGQWFQGYWNNTVVGSNTNVREPEATTLNYGADGDCYFVTPVTSSGQEDATMTDLIYTNSRTGVSKRYSVSGSTEEAVINTVNASVQYQHLHASDVVYENVGGKMTAITPILAEDHTIRGLALVDVQTRTMEWDASPLVALAKYQSLTSSFGSVLATDIATSRTSLRGVVDRVNSVSNTNGALFYFSLKNRDQIFSVPQVYSEILITEKGDSVYISFVEKNTDIVPVEDFDNLDLDVHFSENQQDVVDRAKERYNQEETSDSRQSVKHQIENGEVSDETLDSLARILDKKK